ncbi:MmpS family transport accessory protein [Actinoplanes sp. NPDC049118]|uniref:MmpS family transport accessory protein n=1 Tax=Actinoplanes sp. NPDC049118 TaxID=3155769 RepID=UPI0033E0CFFF
MSGQPWSSPSGDSLAAEPYQPPPPPAPTFQPGYAPLPTAGQQASGPPDGYPPTSQFPAPPGQFPPPAYQPPPGQAPPGQMPPPGYGPPGYGPPPGYGGSPPPPPKRSNLPLVAVLVAVVLLLCAGGVTSIVLVVNNAKQKAEEALESIPRPTDLPTGLPTDLPTGLPTGLPTDLPTDLPDLPGLDQKAQIEVEYAVTGDGPVEIVYVEKLGGEPQRVRNASLPWRKTLTMKGSSLVSVVAVRGSTSEGELSCSAKVDGEEVAQKTSSGTFITASCTKVIF